MKEENLLQTQFAALGYWIKAENSRLKHSKTHQTQAKRIVLHGILFKHIMN
jgi:hypothetical protein